MHYNCKYNEDEYDWRKNTKYCFIKDEAGQTDTNLEKQ